MANQPHAAMIAYCYPMTCGALQELTILNGDSLDKYSAPHWGELCDRNGQVLVEYPVKSRIRLVLSSSRGS